jgi:hypothetical protein
MKAGVTALLKEFKEEKVIQAKSDQIKEEK